MSCAETRKALLELGVDQFDGLPHLERCPDCRALADAIREGEADLGVALDAFGAAVPIHAALRAARGAEPAPPARGGPMFTQIQSLVIAAAAVATFAMAGWVGSGRDGAAVEPPVSAAAEDEGWERDTVALAAANPDDPDPAYALAVHFSSQGVEGAADTIAWADTALDRRAAWTGPTFTDRVAELFALRAAASQALWAASPDDREARRQTADHARKWLDYQRAAGLDTRAAWQLCSTASGTPCD